MTILDKIIEAKSKKIKNLVIGKYQKKKVNENRFYAELRDNDFTVIYEFKRSTPSSGILKENAKIIEELSRYKSMGAKVVSILTEEDYFLGSYDDIIVAKKEYPELIVLNKDFIYQEIQIEKAAEIGADAILLIGKILSKERLNSLRCFAENLGLAVLYEAYTIEDIEKANELKFPVVGVNNRDLSTFKVNLNHSRNLSSKINYPAIIVSESGMSSQDDIDSVKDHAKAALVGSAFMRGLSYAI